MFELAALTAGGGFIFLALTWIAVLERERRFHVRQHEQMSRATARLRQIRGLVESRKTGWVRNTRKAIRESNIAGEIDMNAPFAAAAAATPHEPPQWYTVSAAHFMQLSAMAGDIP